MKGVEIIDPGQVVYVDSGLDGVVGKAVILECGSTRPDVYIWGFTQPGTDAIKAVVYDFGKDIKFTLHHSIALILNSHYTTS
ncbi:unnamed protein product [Coregonus sp. 'balchen']|nr:unnamed protein product [Coregonus sp. 'balchen']